MKKLTITFLFLNTLISVFGQKSVYIPRFITNEGMNLNDPNSQWCYCRSIETENFIIFWEAGFGSNPSTATGTYQVPMNSLMEVAEKSYHVNVDSLGFAYEGSSVIDDYKIMIFLLYSTEWAAYGSGQDNLVGTLHVNPAAARIPTVLAHEIGHTFQYITGCDTDGGYRYGFGVNGAGGNGFWEQSAQWQAFKTYPQNQFTAGDFNNYLNNHHLNLLHESPRYASYFVHDYWAYKRGLKSVGRLWRDSRRPEDPIETYKRLFSVTQSQFNNEMYEHASRLTTWDLPAIRSYGANYINRRQQVAMTKTDEDFWRVNPSVCIQNYGYNSIKLNAPSQATEVSVTFRGLAGESGYRAINVNQGGWRYGFVALLNDGTRVYSDMGSANVSGGNNPEQTLSFMCPDNCKNLWLVVSGSPQSHWRHPWDDDSNNDEQWPYEVQFTNTNLLGIFDNPIHDETLTYNITMEPRSDYTPDIITLNISKISSAFAMPPDQIASKLGTSVKYYGVNPDNSLNANSTANNPGHWFGANGQTVSWGTTAYVFSELNINTLEARIGQYPNRSQDGDDFTIRQALIYTNDANQTARVNLIFNVSIRDEVVSGIDEKELNTNISMFPNPANKQLNFSQMVDWTIRTQDGRLLISGKGRSTDLSLVEKGIYLVEMKTMGQFKVDKLVIE